MLNDLLRRYGNSLNHILYPTATPFRQFAAGAYKIDNNPRDKTIMDFEKVVHVAYAAGLAGAPLTNDLVFDWRRAWLGESLIRSSHVVLTGTSIVAPDCRQIHDCLRSLIGGESFSFALGDTYAAGRAETEYNKRDLNNFLAWLWIEFISIQVFQDGNKRTGALLVAYYLGRHNAGAAATRWVEPSDCWNKCLLQPDPHTVLSAQLQLTTTQAAPLHVGV